jgi:hypothetical protein
MSYAPLNNHKLKLVGILNYANFGKNMLLFFLFFFAKLNNTSWFKIVF